MFVQLDRHEDDPEVSYKWVTANAFDEPQLMLKLGVNLVLMLTPPELGGLCGVLLHAIEDTPLPAPVVETIPFTYE